ncbi:isochorismatase family protein [Micromonospora zingiberis]|uniref:Isochorismatase family protein n=1 Tax=Micromonospora zingiberis TaxID=2053011 RepID=A0A4R0G221_9ACTN|nr:isochorismatase family protein [Micromonospora zingiberis]TCB88751.1 isochorismatase family protein [Micromonospora zingiberis]
MVDPTDHTTFTIENSAVVLVDHQVGTIGWAGELTSQDQRDQLRMWVLVLARFAKSAGIPVVLTSGQEDQAQGPMLPEFKDILPQEHENRIQRTGVVNAWHDPAFVEAVRATDKQNLIMAGVTTDVCLVPPALSAKAEGFEVVALTDVSAASTGTAALNSRDLLHRAGIALLTTAPMISGMLGDYSVPAAAGLFEAMAAEGVYDAFARGSLR